VVVLGPTAGGKSDVAVALARQFRGEIVSADSMQIYRELDAGTAKPEPELRNAAPHHLIDVVDPTEPFSVADWLEQAEALIPRIQARGNLPIVVGGTNLYLKALLEGMFEGPPADEAFRRSLDRIDSAKLHQRLQGVDPEAAARIHPNDRKRIVRALEVYHQTGQPISRQQRQWSDQVSPGQRETQQNPAAPTQDRAQPDRPETPRYRYAPILIGLRWSPEAINRRINARVKRMFHPDDDREGLVEETRRLWEAGRLGPQAAEAIGTRQVLEHLAGRRTLEETMERVKIDTRRFAKTQRSWLKRYRGVHWLDAETLGAEGVNREAVRIVTEALGGPGEAPAPDGPAEKARKPR
jgi:tRNA dimethylallyltransferase